MVRPPPPPRGHHRLLLAAVRVGRGDGRRAPSARGRRPSAPRTRSSAPATSPWGKPSTRRGAPGSTPCPAGRCSSSATTSSARRGSRRERWSTGARAAVRSRTGTVRERERRRPTRRLQSGVLEATPSTSRRVPAAAGEDGPASLLVLSPVVRHRETIARRHGPRVAAVGAEVSRPLGPLGPSTCPCRFRSSHRARGAACLEATAPAHRRRHAARPCVRLSR